MSGFGAEFKNMRNAGGAPKLTESAVAEAETSSAAKASAPPVETDPDQEVFAQPFADGQTLGDSTSNGEPPVIPPPRIETKKAVKINGKNFESVEEAMEYAAELERTIEKEEAFRKGQESTKPAEMKPAEKKRMHKIAEKLFENPEEAFDELEALIEEKANKLIEDRDTQKTQAQTQAETAKSTWDNFYKTNSDLADWQNEVDSITKREWPTLQHMPAAQGLAEIARLTREYVASVKERSLPKSALNSAPARTSNGGTQSTTTTQTPATEKKVSFAAQVRSTNKRTVMQGEV